MCKNAQGGGGGRSSLCRMFKDFLRFPFTTDVNMLTFLHRFSRSLSVFRSSILDARNYRFWFQNCIKLHCPARECTVMCITLAIKNKKNHSYSILKKLLCVSFLITRRFVWKYLKIYIDFKGYFLVKCVLYIVVSSIKSSADVVFITLANIVPCIRS